MEKVNEGQQTTALLAKTVDIGSLDNPMNLIGAINDIQNQLTSSTSIAMLFGNTVGTVSESTGFDRVMMYRFDECKCGAVVAEYLNPLASQDLLLGLHFPSSDLPPWIRQLYKEDRIHVLRSRTSDRASLRSRDLDKLVSLDLKTPYLGKWLRTRCNCYLI